MKKKIFTILLTTILLAGCGADAENTTTADSETATSSESISDTEQEPYVVSFEGTTTEGETLTSDCFAESKLTMLNVWATYCSPCLDEMPDLGEIANSYNKSEFQVIGVVSDVMEGGEESQLETAKDLITETHAEYPHLVLNESLYNTLVGGVDSVPTTFFINENGELLTYVVGAQSKENWEEIINELLAEVP